MGIMGTGSPLFYIISHICDDQGAVPPLFCLSLGVKPHHFIMIDLQHNKKGSRMGPKWLLLHCMSHRGYVGVCFNHWCANGLCMQQLCFYVWVLNELALLVFDLVKIKNDEPPFLRIDLINYLIIVVLPIGVFSALSVCVLQ